MIDDVLLGLGLVAIFEGLVFALAANRLRDLLAMIEQIGAERCRFIGLATVAAGVALVWLARG